MHRLFRQRDERGVALVTAIMVSFVATLFISSMMFVAFHNQTSSAHNRSWGQALHVAESGVHEAIAYLQNSSGVVPAGTVTGTTNEGTYQYLVSAQSRNRYQIDAVGTVGTASSTMASRRLRVTMAPPTSFKYALYSLTDVVLKNNFTICGDVYSGSSFDIGNNNSVLNGSSSACGGTSGGSGNVTTATGYISMGNGSAIDGTAWSGGNSASGVGISGTIGGDAKASSSTPGCADDAAHAKYKISGSVTGNATAWGAIPATVTGSKTPNTCTAASTALPIPTFVYNSANYAAGTTHVYNFPTDYAAFNSYIAANSSNLSGTFYITGGDASYPVNLGAATVTGDLTVVATAAPIEGSGGLNASSSTDKIIVLASWYPGTGACSGNSGNPGDCAIGFKNNFSPDTANTAVLLYAPNGPIAIKNNASFKGAAYANNIQFKNNATVIYDPRLQQIVGFGTSTLDITDWQECDPGAVTTSSCG